MPYSMLNFWLLLGGVLVIAEIFIPGLVSVFVGLGALTVATLLKLKQIESIDHQLIAWVLSSTLYIFSIRLVLVKFYPVDRVKHDIDDDQTMIGKIATVTQPILGPGGGRIEYGGTSWTAHCESDEKIEVGTQVKIMGRKNISWTVQSLTNSTHSNPIPPIENDPILDPKSDEEN